MKSRLLYSLSFLNKSNLILSQLTTSVFVSHGSSVVCQLLSPLQGETLLLPVPEHCIAPEKTHDKSSPSTVQSNRDMSLYVAPLSQLCSLPSVTVALHSSTDYNMWWVKAVFILFSTVVADFDADLLKLSEEFDSPGNVFQPVFIVNIANIYFRYTVQLFVSISLYFRYKWTLSISACLV